MKRQIIFFKKQAHLLGDSPGSSPSSNPELTKTVSVVMETLASLPERYKNDPKKLAIIEAIIVNIKKITDWRGDDSEIDPEIDTVTKQNAIRDIEQEIEGLISAIKPDSSEEHLRELALFWEARVNEYMNKSNENVCESFATWSFKSF